MPGSPYPTSRQQLLMGDPFFGAFAGLLAKPIAKGVVGIGKKLIGKGGVKLPKLIGPAGSPGAAAPITRVAIPTIAAAPAGILKAVGGVAKAAGGLLTGTAIGAGIGTLAPEVVGSLMPGARRRIRRMNALNPKALRRAMRRVSGFTYAARCAERDLASFCRPRSSGRRCSPRKGRKACR